MHPDASQQKRVAITPANLSSFLMLSLFSPDGNAIAYRSFNYLSLDPGEIWYLNADGSNTRRVVSDAALMSNFAFSPDSRYLLYAKTKSVQDAQVPGRVILSSGTNQEGAAFKGVGSFYRSQDELLVINSQFELFYEPFTGGTKTRLAGTPASGANLWKTIPSPDRSRLILHYHYFSGSVLDELWLLSPAGGSQVRLDFFQAPGEIGDFIPVWSADSRTLAYRVAGTINGREGLYILTPGAATPRRIVVGNNFSSFMLAPDGSYLAFTRSGSSSLFLIRADGTGEVEVSAFPGGGVADWTW